MKFLCDEMLKRPGQWLRVAGYDVPMLPDGTYDRALIQRAVEEHRLLATRGRETAALANGRVEIASIWKIVCERSNDSWISTGCTPRSAAAAGLRARPSSAPKCVRIFSITQDLRHAQ